MDNNSIKDFLTLHSIPFLQNEPMSRHTTFKIGGPADFFVKPQNENDALTVLNFAASENIKLTVIGNGSNLLVADSGVNGIVMSMSALNGITVNGNIITAYAGAPLSSVCLAALENGLSGLEFAYGIPGFTGGAVIMNAGAYGGEIKDCLIYADVILQGKKVRLTASELNFGYRTSSLKNRDAVILSAAFKLNAANKEIIKSKMDELMARRIKKQPLEYPSAGSTFKRPEGNYAGALIEAAGMKGKQIGGAQISEKHAGFLINKGTATANDVLSLISFVKAEVLKTSGISLEEEIICIGRN